MSIDYEQRVEYVDIEIRKLMKYYNFKNYEQENNIRLAIRENERRYKYMDRIKQIATAGTIEEHQQLI